MFIRYVFNPEKGILAVYKYARAWRAGRKRDPKSSGAGILHYAVQQMIEFTTHDTYSILDLKIEEIDFVKAPKFTDMITSYLEKVRYPNIILDLDSLYYIDSTGLSSLINISRKIKDNDHEMVVVCTSTKILQLFDIAKLGMFFKIFDSVENAEKYLAEKP
jgi:anti-sigma B factor antagonist